MVERRRAPSGHGLAAHLSVCQEPALPSASVVSVEKRSFPASILPCHQPDDRNPDFCPRLKGRVPCCRVRAAFARFCSHRASCSLSGVPVGSRRGTALPLTRGSPGVAVGRSRSCLASLPSLGTGRGAGASVLFGPGVLSGSERRGRLSLPTAPGRRPGWPGWRSQGWLQASLRAARGPGSPGFGGGDPWLGPRSSLALSSGGLCHVLLF